MYTDKMLSSKKTLLLYITAALLLAALEVFMYAFLKSAYEERKTNYISTITNDWDKGYESVMRHFRMLTDTVMFGLNNDKKLKEILRQANKDGDIELAHNAILAEYGELDLVNQKNSLIKIFQIHDKKGNALVRFQKPEKYGDNVLSYLGVIIATHKNKSFTQGFEGGKYFNAYRFVYPIMDGEEFVGSVQLGFEESAINKNMQEDFMVDSYIAVNEKKNKVSKNELSKSPLSTADKTLVHHDRAYSKEKQQLIANFFADKQKELTNAVSSGKKLAFSTKINDDYYAVTVEPFADFKNEEMGYLVLYSKDTNLVLIEKDYLISLVLGLTLILFAWVIVMTAFVRYLQTEDRLEQEILKRQEKEKMLFQQSKMAMMGEMIGAIAHQWRQPLNSISIWVYNICAMQEDGELTAKEMKEFRDTMTSTVQRMSETIDDFRDFFKPTKSKIEFSVEDTVKATLKIMSPQLKKRGIACQVETNGASVLYGYKNELEQAIMILISNAQDALVSNNTKEPQIKITITDERDKIALSIQDNGGGVPEEIKERIFEPYFTTKSASSGTGIGLYMAQEIAHKLMGGKLYLENVNGGACFTIEMPHETAPKQEDSTKAS